MDNKIREKFLDSFDEVYTENGARAKSTTKDYLVDLLGHGGAMRNREMLDCEKLFSRALSQDADKAMKLLFYLRDARGGQGERRFFRICMKYVALLFPETAIKNLEFIPEFGRWDDVIELIGLNNKVDEAIKKLLRKQIAEDLRVEYPSLLGKWLPSERAGKKSYENFRKVVTLLYGEFNYNNAALFRKKISSPLRKRIHIIETDITNKCYEGINYSKVPSLAMNRYRQLFYEKDNERFSEYISSLTKGTAKINTDTLTPYDIVHKVLELGMSPVNNETASFFDAQWAALKEYRSEDAKENIVICDTSGSMWGRPLEVAISLSIYLSERNEGAFYNKFITFSAEPQLKAIAGKTLVEKVRNLWGDDDWGLNTNIEAVFDKVLEFALDNHVEPKDLVKNIFIISDMEFDAATPVESKNTDTLFETIRKKYEKAGYTMPHLIFWNVNARSDQFPCDVNEDATFISGFSPAHLQFALGKATEVVEQICSSERYEKIKF